MLESEQWVRLHNGFLILVYERKVESRSGRFGDFNPVLEQGLGRLGTSYAHWRETCSKALSSGPGEVVVTSFISGTKKMGSGSPGISTWYLFSARNPILLNHHILRSDCFLLFDQSGWSGQYQVGL